MKNYKAVFLAFFILISCNQIVNHKEDNLDSVTTISEKKVENKKNDNAEISKNGIDTIVVKNQTAIIIEPTNKQIEKRKKEVGAEDFYIGADDYMWYLNESTETFRKNKLNVLNIKNGKTIKFEMQNGNNAILELNGEDELWQIYLFDPKLKPKKIDMTDSENEYKTYFK
jgi:GTP cyclohydrolase III